MSDQSSVDTDRSAVTRYWGDDHEMYVSEFPEQSVDSGAEQEADR